MSRLRSLLPALALALVPALASAQGHHGHGAASPSSPYAGYGAREIKSLSREDIEELRRGGGWGLALAAELNGAPGPAHLLELRDRIPLDPRQVEAIETIYEEMKAQAIPAGERLISAEARLEAAFAGGGLEEAELRALLGDIERARAELRFIHLSRHLSTPPLLSEEQIARYNTLRGYGSDPCASVPEGHDTDMWRRHNNCR